LTTHADARLRTMQMLEAPMCSASSGHLDSTDRADYVVVAEGSSPERQCAIVCHEVAHSLLGHSHDESPGNTLIESGLLQSVDPELANDVVEARHAYAHTRESDAEVVATYISVKLRRRVMRGGNTYYDSLWQ